MPTVELKAPPGKFRVVCVDTFDGTDWVSKDCDTQEEAIKFADDSVKDEEMMMMHVYDDTGYHLYEAGNF